MTEGGCLGLFRCTQSNHGLFKSVEPSPANVIEENLERDSSCWLCRWGEGNVLRFAMSSRREERQGNKLFYQTLRKDYSPANTLAIAE